MKMRMKKINILGCLVAILLLVTIFALGIYIYEKPFIYRVEDIPQVDLAVRPEVSLYNLLKNISNMTIVDGDCYDYAKYYYNILTRNYPELDVRWERGVDLCNKATLCKSLHTFLVVGGYGEECLLDQHTIRCIELIKDV
jgi:hypothetical protein